LNRPFLAFLSEAQHGGFFMLINLELPMQLNEIETQLKQRFDSESVRGWVEQVVPHDLWAIRVAYGINRRGEGQYRYWIGRHRVQRQMLLTLTCRQTACPRRQTALEAWTRFADTSIQHAAQSAKHLGAVKSSPVFISQLTEEVQLPGPSPENDPRPWTARRARLPVEMVCPHGAHVPLRVPVDAWDLYGPDGYAAGGLKHGVPLLATLDDARAWIASLIPQSEAIVA